MIFSNNGRNVKNIPLKNTLRKWTQSKASAYLIPWFITRFGIERSQAERPIKDYDSLESFFTRKLKPGSRPFDAADDVLVSPVDGRLSVVTMVMEDSVFYVKDKPYRLSELFERDDVTELFLGGTLMVLYLSPADYHRIHVPLKAREVFSYEKGGFSWPVNDFGLKYFKNVLTRNYRRISLLETEDFPFAMVSVGALNVNSVIQSAPGQEYYDKMEEYAYFSFGSTVVLVFPKGVIRGELSHRHVKAGESLTTIHA